VLGDRAGNCFGSEVLFEEISPSPFLDNFRFADDPGVIVWWLEAEIPSGHSAGEGFKSAIQS